MKRKNNIICIFCLVALCAVTALIFVACGTPNDIGTPENPNPPHEPDLTEITGVEFLSAEYDYDGTEKTLTITGNLPQGVNVSYTGNKGTAVGTYNAKATLTGEGYKTKELTATLTIKGLEITGVEFLSAEYDYDGTEKTLTITGDLPQGVSVSYTVNKGTNAGTYNAKATLSGEGYNTKELTAILTINKVEIAGIAFNGDTVEYDSKLHSIQITGNLPQGVTATYYYDGVAANGVSEVGKHEVKCVMTGNNHVTKELTATLTIKATEEQLFCAALNGTVYFQNALDGKKLYAADASGLRKISNDTPDSFASTSSKLYYFDSGIWTKTIKCYDGSKTSALYSQSGDHIAADGSNIYYAVNNLFNRSENGIYKLPATPSDGTEPQRLAECDAKYLVYCNGYIYFANSSDGGYLYRVSVNGGTPELIKDEAASDLIADGSTVYFNATKQIAGIVGVAKAIYKYDTLSGATVKLTTDAGKYLVKIGSYLYYVNNDKLTSAIFGDGIYRVSTIASSDSSLPGEKVLSVENNGYCSLSTDGVNLYFYKLNDKHLYKYSLSGQTETDVMAGFVAPEEKVTPTGFSNLVAHNGEIYYTNPNDGSALYKYDPTTGGAVRVISSAVSSFYFDGDYMYYDTFILTNYAFWRINLNTNEVEKLSSKRYENLIIEDGVIYCVNYGVSKNTICTFDPSAGEHTAIYDAKPANIVGFEKVGDDFYFIMNPAFGYQYIYKYDAATASGAELNSIKAKDLVYYGGRLYYYASDDNLCSCNLDGGDIKTHAENVEINSMFVADGKLYYSSKSSKNKGLFVLDIASDTVSKIDDSPANGIAVSDGKVYWLRSVVSYTAAQPSQASAYDCCLYCYDGTSVKKVA